MVATGGLGVTIEELFALFDCTMADGPMLGECAVEYHGELRGRAHATTCAPRSSTSARKEGRSGRFDLVRMDAVIEDTATCHFTYVVPRR